jgi:subtilisin family serine protease
MKQIRNALLLSALGLAACGDAPVSPAAGGGTAARNESSAGTDYVVSFKNDNVPSSFADRVAALGGTVSAAYDGAGLAVVTGIDAAGAATLADFGEVGPDEVFQILDPASGPVVDATAVDMDLAVSSPTNPAGAFFFARQWNMRLIGAHTAWSAGKRGSPAVKVAILDTGIDGTHPDLAGLVDLGNSAAFAVTDTSLVKAFFPGAPMTTDLHYHGTHVAATVSSNAVAAAGVTSQTRLMAVKVLNVNGSGATSWILNGIMFAAQRGANVISMSLGDRNLPYDMKNKGNKDFFNKVVDRAFKYAHSKGSMIIVAAGNESQDLSGDQTFKPYCGAMHVVCVSAVGPTAAAGVNGPWTNQDAFATYSNFGTGMIDIAGPGGQAAPVSAACSRTSLQIPVCQTGTFVVGLAGTSMATPHVSGLAALLIAEKRVGAGAVRSAMFNSALDLGDAGKDARFGNGRINVAKALGLQ